MIMLVIFCLIHSIFISVPYHSCLNVCAMFSYFYLQNSEVAHVPNEGELTEFVRVLLFDITEQPKDIATTTLNSLGTNAKA